MSKLVKEALNENVNDYIMQEIEDTMAAYGLTEIERDKILNDPDVYDMIMDMVQQTQGPKDLELVALKVMQYADDEGIVPNEMTNEDWKPEFPGDTPADQGMRAASKEDRAKEVVLGKSFNAAAAAMAELNEMIPSELSEIDEDLFQKLMSAEGAVEELMDAIDAKLQNK